MTYRVVQLNHASARGLKIQNVSYRGLSQCVEEDKLTIPLSCLCSPTGFSSADNSLGTRGNL